MTHDAAHGGGVVHLAEGDHARLKVQAIGRLAGLGGVERGACRFQLDGELLAVLARLVGERCEAR